MALLNSDKIDDLIIRGKVLRAIRIIIEKKGDKNDNKFKEPKP